MEEIVIGVLALLFVLFVAAGIVLTVKTVRAVQRGVERTGTQVRRTVEETTLRAKSAQPGPVGEAARARLELRSSIDSTRRALEAGVAGDPSLREALGLLDRLHEHARQLDGELRLLMEREPDKVRMAQRLPDARERVAHIKQSADSLRHAAQDRAQRYDQEGLEALRRQIEIESGALRHWESGQGQGPDRLGERQHGSGPGLGHGSEGARPGLAPGQAESWHELRRDAEQPRNPQQRAERGQDSRSGFSRFDKGRPQSTS